MKTTPYSTIRPGVLGIIAVGMTFGLVATGDCAAQAALSNTQTTVHSADKTFWDLFRQGGFMMWVMLAVSMFTLSLIIESAMKLHQRVIAPKDLFDQLRVLIA